jgi:uncharacterized iron-regulated membrane protein
MLQRANKQIKRQPSKLATRRIWFAIHKWLGLSAGLLFVLIGLTGSILVFDHAIDEWLNPDLLLTSETGERQSVQAVVAAAEQGFRGPEQRAASLSRPRVTNGVWTVWFSSGTTAEPTFTAVYVDPYTLRVTGQRVWGQDLMSQIYRLHYCLLAGKIGATVVGLFGLALMVSVLSGAYLWWPLLCNSLRAAFAIRRGRRLAFDLHKVVGVSSALFLLLLAFTGVYMEFPQLFRGVAGMLMLSSSKSDHTELKSTGSHSRRSITADEAIEIAQAQFPHARWDHLHPPKDSDGVFEVALRQPNEVQRSYGRTQVHIDRYTGNILKVVDPNHGSAADAFFAAQFPLHSGEALGMFGRWLVFVTGLTPAVLYVTGLVVWWRKSQAKQRQQRTARDTKTHEPSPKASPVVEP